MVGLHDVIGLLYRADWTRLSLSAEVRFEQDGDLARRRENAVRAESMRRMGFRPGSPGMPDVEQEPDAERDVYHRWHAALLIAPGRRYRLEYEGDHGGRADGSDGEQAWTLRPPDAAPLPPRDFENGPGLPVPALFRPAGLLARFTLDVGGPVTACGREAIAVTAVPRHGAVGSGTSLRPPASDRVELIVDAETGFMAAMPSPEPGPLDPGDGPLPSDDLLGLLYRSGQYDGDDPQVRGAAVRRWNDTKAVLGQVPGTFRAAGQDRGPVKERSWPGRGRPRQERGCARPGPRGTRRSMPACGTCGAPSTPAACIPARSAGSCAELPACSAVGNSCVRNRSLPGSSPSAVIATVTAPMADSRSAGGWAPGPAARASAPGYFKMLTARATTSATVTMEMTDCRAMASFAQRDSGITSVGLNADALVNAR